MRTVEAEVWDAEFALSDEQAWQGFCEDLAAQHVRGPMIVLARVTL